MTSKSELSAPDHVVMWFNKQSPVLPPPLATCVSNKSEMRHDCNKTKSKATCLIFGCPTTWLTRCQDCISRVWTPGRRDGPRFARTTAAMARRARLIKQPPELAGVRAGARFKMQIASRVNSAPFDWAAAGGNFSTVRSSDCIRPYPRAGTVRYS